jgi:hypothetical protein
MNASQAAARIVREATRDQTILAHSSMATLFLPDGLELSHFLDSIF